MIALGIDPGFARLGWAVVEVQPAVETVRALGVLATEKSAKKLDVRASSDNVRRARELAVEVARLLDFWHVDVVCAESMSFTRDASVSQKIGIAWGILAALVESRGLPLVQASPQAIKSVLCGRKDASKDDVQYALRTRYPSVPDLLDPLRKGDLEHGADAIGAVVACLDSELIRALRRAAA